MSAVTRTVVQLLVFLVAVSGYNITILHTNDIHARIDQLNKYGGQCPPDDATEGKCYGGFPRLMTKIREIRSSTENTLLLDGGDQFTGTLWYYKFRGAGIAQFMNLLGYDAMAIGNHEFDNGPSGLIPFLDAVNFEPLSSNIKLDPTSALNGKFKKSHVMTVGGERIGIIGYTTTSTSYISNPGQLVSFEDEVAAVRQEVTSLTQQGVNKIIAVGHSGFAADQKIASDVEGIDIIVGGHSNTFLYKGDAPSNEDPEGEYPHVVTQSNGAKVLVVQDYAYGKYLGELQVTFDTQGVVTSWGGNPILLDNNTAQAADILSAMQPYKDILQNETDTVIGRAHVLLSGFRDDCRVGECNLGDLITDAMIRQNIKHSDSLYWNNVSIAVYNSGGIRSSVLKGDITLGDVGQVMPFSNTVDILELYGRDLIAALEHSVSGFTSPTSSDGDGRFLQVGGLRVEYDVSRKVGDRVVRVRAHCTQCEIPRYEDLRSDHVYQVITNNFLAQGGDGYSVFKEKRLKYHQNGDLDFDVLVDYITQHTPIIHGEEDRILFVSPEQPCQNDDPTSAVEMHLPSVLLMLLVMISFKSIV